MLSAFSVLNMHDKFMIQFTNLSVFVLFQIVGTVLIVSASRSGKFIMLLCFQDIIRVGDTFLFTFILNIPT